MTLKINSMFIKRKLVALRNKKITHGVIQKRNLFGITKYSLVRSKQNRFTDTFELSPKIKSENITNLTNELQRVYYNGCEFETLFDKYPHLSRTVGSFPQKWGRKIGNNSEKREQIQKLFSDFAKEFHEKVKIQESQITMDTTNLQKSLSRILQTKVKVSEFKKGSWGQTYIINADNQDYILKVYYNESPLVYGGFEHCHGNFFELSSAMWATKNDADHYATCYMGKFGENFDGYILTKYIPEREKNGRIFNGKENDNKYNFVFSNYLHKLHCDDTSASCSLNINGKKIFDFGETYPTIASKLDYPTYKLAKTLGRFIDENNSKELRKYIEKYKGTKVYKNAVSFLQYLINKNCTVDNMNTLKTKKDLLKQLGLDYVPDVRYILEREKHHFPKRKYYDDPLYEDMFGLPVKAFQQIWDKYHEILGL